MTKEQALPYYRGFSHWLSLVRPDIAFNFMRGNMGVSEIHPYIREWAEDITGNG